MTIGNLHIERYWWRHWVVKKTVRGVTVKITACPSLIEAIVKGVLA